MKIIKTMRKNNQSEIIVILLANIENLLNNECNHQFRKTKFTPIFFHNLSGYDSHLFIKNIDKTQGNIKCIPNNEEKYISFSMDLEVDKYTVESKEKKVMHDLWFLDTYKFMPSSHNSLVANMKVCSKSESCCPGDCLKEGGIEPCKNVEICQHRNV